MTHALLAIHGGEPAVPADLLLPRWPPASNAQSDALCRVEASGAWGSNVGDEVHAFEREFSRRHGVRHAVATVNGTIALVAALHAVGVSWGDEVIVPAYTFIATASAPLMVGAIPVFADVDPRTHLIDADHAASLVTPRTRAIIAVHLAGRVAEMDALRAIADRHGIALIEDAAQAVGAEYLGRPVGGLGDVATFSFQSSKNLTAGEGGLMTTDRDDLAAALYSYVNVGRVPGGGWYEHRTLGYNLRLGEFQGALLRAQLETFDEQQARRERSARRLDAALAGHGDVLVAPDDGSTTVHGRHLYLLRAPGLGATGARDAAVAALHAEGVTGAFGGYVPLHRSAPLVREADRIAARLGVPTMPRSCPATDLLCSDTIWLDQRELLADDDRVDAVGAAIRKVVDAGADALTKGARG